MGNPVTTTGNDIYSGLLLQLVRESTPGTYDPSGQRTVMTQVKGDFVPEDQWGNFRPDGFNEDAWNQLSKTHRIFNGTLSLDYSTLNVLAEMTCGVSNYVATNPTSDTVQETFETPAMGARSIYTYTIERGTPGNCVRCTYGFVSASSGEIDRDAATSTGSITIICRKPSAEGVPMTGGVLQNSKYTLVAAGASGNLVVTYLLPGASLGQQVTLALGDSALAIKGKFEAFGDGVAVNVVGPLTNGGTLSTGGTASASVSDNVSTSDKAFDGNTSTEWASAASPTQWLQYDRGAGNAAVATNYTVLPRADGIQSPSSFTFAGSNDGTTFTTLDTQTNLTLPAGGQTFVFANTVAYRYYRITVTKINNGTTGANTGGVNIVEFSFAGAPTTIEFASPANARVVLSKTSGVAGYSVSETQVGSDGKLRIPKRVPIAPQSMTYREADTRAGLDSATPASKTKMVSFAFDSLATAEYFASENNLTFDSHTDNADAKRTLNVKMARSGSLVSGLRLAAESQPSSPRWRELRAAHIDGKHLLRVQMFASVMGAAPLQAAGNVQSYQFPMSSVLTDTPGSDNSAAITIRRAL